MGKRPTMNYLVFQMSYFQGLIQLLFILLIRLDLSIRPSKGSCPHSHLTSGWYWSSVWRRNVLTLVVSSGKHFLSTEEFKIKRFVPKLTKIYVKKNFTDHYLWFLIIAKVVPSLPLEDKQSGWACNVSRARLLTSRLYVQRPFVMLVWRPKAK